jgi:hypothetical protein
MKYVIWYLINMFIFAVVFRKKTGKNFINRFNC